MRNICKNHIDEFSDIVACNDCNMLTGYVLQGGKSLKGAIFCAPGFPNLFQSAEDATKFAKKYGIGRDWKPKQCYIHFD